MSTAKKVKSSGNKRSGKSAASSATLAPRPVPVPVAGARPGTLKSNPPTAPTSTSKVSVTKPTVATATKPARASKAKGGADKMARDTFRMPRADFDLLRALKVRARALGQPSKKSELLRAGLHALSAYADDQLRSALADRAVIPTPSAKVAVDKSTKPGRRQK